jgi:hypothetical protein
MLWILARYPVRRYSRESAASSPEPEMAAILATEAEGIAWPTSRAAPGGLKFGGDAVFRMTSAGEVYLGQAFVDLAEYARPKVDPQQLPSGDGKIRVVGVIGDGMEARPFSCAARC